MNSWVVLWTGMNRVVLICAVTDRSAGLLQIQCWLWLSIGQGELISLTLGNTATVPMGLCGPEPFKEMVQVQAAQHCTRLPRCELRIWPKCQILCPIHLPLGPSAQPISRPTFPMPLDTFIPLFSHGRVFLWNYAFLL